VSVCHDFAIIANTAETCSVFGRGVDLEAGVSFLFKMASMVVADSEFQVHPGDLHVLVRVLDAQVTYIMAGSSTDLTESTFVLCRAQNR
jgi:adenine-specific DNA methylase